MAAWKKIAGLAAGVATVASIGVAVAQGVPPNPFITNPALGAGQQSTHLTPMGETGVSGLIDVVQAAQITPVPEPVAQAPAPAPAPAPEPQTMGAAPEPAPAPVAEAPAPTPAPVVARADRN